jgi:hypothetical protein
MVIHIMAGVKIGSTDRGTNKIKFEYCLWRRLRCSLFECSPYVPTWVSKMWNLRRWDINPCRGGVLLFLFVATLKYGFIYRQFICINRPGFAGVPRSDELGRVRTQRTVSALNPFFLTGLANTFPSLIAAFSVLFTR